MLYTRLEKLKPERKAQVYALVAWEGKTIEEALDLVESKSFEEIDEIVHCRSSVSVASGSVRSSEKKLRESDNPESIVVLICDKIHQKWVAENPGKYKRKNLEKSEQMLFQHLPTPFIGIDELCKDAMFLAPFLEDLGIHIGTMGAQPYSAFVPTKAFEDAYNDYARNCCEANHINSVTDLETIIENIIEEYPPLAITDNPATQERHDFMAERTSLLAEEAMQKSPKIVASTKR